MIEIPPPEPLQAVSTLGPSVSFVPPTAVASGWPDGSSMAKNFAFEFAARSPDRASAVVSAAFDRGLVLLSCGLYGNVIRLLPPLNIAADELGEGLAILEESLGA